MLQAVFNPHPRSNVESEVHNQLGVRNIRSMLTCAPGMAPPLSTDDDREPSTARDDWMHTASECKHAQTNPRAQMNEVTDVDVHNAFMRIVQARVQDDWRSGLSSAHTEQHLNNGRQSRAHLAHTLTQHSIGRSISASSTIRGSGMNLCSM
jgi:hypothetical protein